MTGRFGKPNHTGRSSGRYGGKLRKIYGPPSGEAWCWFTRGMLLSPAWKVLSVNGRKFIDFLCIEYMNHAGQTNGELKAPYDHLCVYGLTRELIPSVIDEVIALGFVRCGLRRKRIATNYRLTFYGDGQPPSNEWSAITREKAMAIKKEISQFKGKRSRNLVRDI